jgi:excisionase family DNA binding protein
MDERNGELLTLAEMAGKLKVPVSWVYSRTRERGEGAIPRLKVGKYLRFKESDVMNWIREKQQNNN